MCHAGQKRINKIATGLRENEIWLYGHYVTSIEEMREFVKKHKLHYTKKMMEKAKKRGTW